LPKPLPLAKRLAARLRNPHDHAQSWQTQHKKARSLAAVDTPKSAAGYR